ncbi:response regulator, partial [Candidatus Dependentiae bacterium]|nr:response regulator [Candidatus Dependentiae bacterium]
MKIKKKYPKILVVDDVFTNLEIIETHLSEKNYVVEKLNNGDDAINKIIESIPDNLPDLILLDVEMPGKNGYEVCSIIKNA